MTITERVRELLDTTDVRVMGRIGSDALFTGECDHCTSEPAVLIAVTTDQRRGATEEGHIYCLRHAAAAIDVITWASDCDDIAVTVPASLIDAISPDLAA